MSVIEKARAGVLLGPVSTREAKDATSSSWAGCETGKRGRTARPSQKRGRGGAGKRWERFSAGAGAKSEVGSTPSLLAKPSRLQELVGTVAEALVGLCQLKGRKEKGGDGSQAGSGTHN